MAGSGGRSSEGWGLPGRECDLDRERDRLPKDMVKRSWNLLRGLVEDSSREGRGALEIGMGKAFSTGGWGYRRAFGVEGVTVVFVAVVVEDKGLD